MSVPHEPLIKIYGVVPSECFIFKSAKQPIKLTFLARRLSPFWKEGDQLQELSNYSLVFKNGDDLR